MPHRILSAALLLTLSLAGCARQGDQSARPVSGPYLGTGAGGG